MTTNHCHHEYNVNRDKRAGGEKKILNECGNNGYIIHE